MKIIEGSGNVFKDIGLDDPEGRQVKARIAIIIESLIKSNCWSQEVAAQHMGISQSDVCNIVRGKLKNYSLERLFRCLNAIDQDIEINVRPKTHDQGQVLVACK